MLHYELNNAERMAITGKQNGALFDRPEMLCRTGDAHAEGTRVVDRVMCGRCRTTLATFLPYRGN